MSKPELKFLDLTTRHVGISPGVGLGYAEAATVSLDRYHSSPCNFAITDKGVSQTANAKWDAGTAQLQAAWANIDDATRDGAYALAIAAIEETRKLWAVRRAETRTGADYYLSEKNSIPTDLENCIRLEVSGTADGTNSMINSRLSQKLEQAKKGKSNLPAIASVVGFSVLKIVCADLEESE